MQHEAEALLARGTEDALQNPCDNTGMDKTTLNPLAHPAPTLADWLAHCERLHPQTIEMGLSRVREVANRLNLHFNCPVVTVAGTNGKGSTCATLESIWGQAGYRTGVYSSPHLVHFEERCRLAGTSVIGTDLLPSFACVEAARQADARKGWAAVSLSYFEFTTLAIMHFMSCAELDVAILEVGLGGRLDAVNLIDTDCAIITSIDLDHTELLGHDRELIGFEKAGILRAHRPAIVGDPVPPQSVIDHATNIGADLWQLGRDFQFAAQSGHERLQWNWTGRQRRYNALAYPALRGANQLVNAAGALAALEALQSRLPVTAQAVRLGLAMVQLLGRFQMVPGQPSLILDVAHNPHAVAALTANLDNQGYFPCTHAVFGAMADKDLASMLTRMAPLVDKWYFTDLPSPRAARAADLLACWEQIHQQTSARQDVTACICTDPQTALDQALAHAQSADRIIVFGSFFTVGGVLQNGVPLLRGSNVE